MPVAEYADAEYADAEDGAQGNITPIDVEPKRNYICQLYKTKRYYAGSRRVRCPVCLHYHSVALEAYMKHKRFRLPTPLHASQVPPQTEYLQFMFQRYPVMWQGLLVMKDVQAAVQLHFLFGNRHIAEIALPFCPPRRTNPLRIVQRMRMEPMQLEYLGRKMEVCYEYCMLFGISCGEGPVDLLLQASNLKSKFIMYFQEKQSAGIVNIGAPGTQQVGFVVHIFPSCEFANNTLARVAPDLLHRISEVPHVLFIIATV